MDARGHDRKGPATRQQPVDGNSEFITDSEKLTAARERFPDAPIDIDKTLLLTARSIGGLFSRVKG